MSYLNNQMLFTDTSILNIISLNYNDEDTKLSSMNYLNYLDNIDHNFGLIISRKDITIIL